MTNYFRPRNWQKYQSKSNNSMSWVKVQVNLLSDPDFLSLTSLQQLHWLKLLLLTGRIGRGLPWDTAYIGRELHEDSRGIGKTLRALKSIGFIELCERTQNLHDKVDLPREEKRREEKSKTPSLSPPPEFEKFWNQYPRQRRGSKTKALSAWNTARQRDSPANILVGLRDYAASDEVRDGYAKGAAAWLADDRWKVDYRTFRKRTAEDMREEFLHGNEGGDLGRGAIDGECVEIPGGGFEAHGDGVSRGAAGSERQTSGGRGECATGELAKGGSTQAGGREDNRRRVDTFVAKAAQACKTRTDT